MWKTERRANCKMRRGHYDVDGMVTRILLALNFFRYKMAWRMWWAKRQGQA